MSKQNPWFWKDGVPYDEYELACVLANSGAVAEDFKRHTGRESLIGVPSHEEIVDMVWKCARRASKRLRSGK